MRETRRHTRFPVLAVARGDQKSLSGEIPREAIGASAYCTIWGVILHTFVLCGIALKTAKGLTQKGYYDIFIISYDNYLLCHDGTYT